MPPKKIKEDIIFLVNVGVARRGTQNNAQLLDKAKFILKHIIQKKIFLRPKDEIGVVLMGSEDCSKSDSAIKFDNINELCSMQVGNWDLIESINKLQTTNQCCSWMEAIYAAVDYIKHECIDKCERKIILLSDFNEEENIVNQFQSDDIAKTLSSEGIIPIAIGLRTLDNIDKHSYTASETLLVDVLQETRGEYLTFELAMSDLRFYKSPSTKPMPWYCQMELGDYHIPIVGFAKIRKEIKLPKLIPIANVSTSDSPDRQVPIKKIAQWTDKNRIIYEKDDIIRGYVFGGKPIPVTDYDKQAMNLKSNEKRYRIHGFTARKNVPMEYWLSDGTYIVIPANESKSAPFYSLVQAMHDKDVVAIVEKVYRKNTGPNMVALFPSIDVPDEPWCLIEIGLPYERDCGTVGQKPLTSVTKQLSKQQSDAIDDLLTSLELPDIGDDDGINDNQRYLPGSLPNPRTQNIWDMLSARALNPDQALPPIADEITNLLEQPEFLKEKCKPAVEKIKNLFFLEKKKPLKAKRHYKAWKQDDNKKIDNNDDVCMAQSAKEKEQNVNNGNNSEAINMTNLSNVCNYDYDDIADI